MAFKGKAKAFVRTYAFLSSILPYTNAGWEKRSIFLNFLIPKLPRVLVSPHRSARSDRLSNIISTFNDLFGDIAWEDRHRVRRLITEEIPSRVAVDTAFRNARENSDKENARIEHDRALLRVMTGVMKDDTELFKQFVDNEGFKRWMSDTVFGLAYDRPAAP